MKNLLFAMLLLATASCNREPLTERLAKARWTDLSHPFDSTTNYWPTNIRFRHDTVTCGINSQGYFYASFKYSAEEHGGTHFDAPLHFSEGGKSIEQVPLEQLHGPGAVVDVTAQCLKNRDYLVGKSDLESWEKQHGRIPDGAIVLLNTGFGKYWDDPVKYTGTLERGAAGVAALHFPGLDPEAARWLTTQRKIKAVGLDTPSIDYGQSKDFMTHRVLCHAGLTAYENLMNLDQLPPVGSYIVALPMKIKGGSGAPLRIVALTEP